MGEIGESAELASACQCMHRVHQPAFAKCTTKGILEHMMISKLPRNEVWLLYRDASC